MRAEREILLVDTSLPGSRGSMARYASLVRLAIESQTVTVAWKPMVLNVAFPWRFPGWLPGSLQTWLNHVWIVASAGRRITNSDCALVHVLDGSFGYLINGVRNRSVVATVHDLIPLMQKNDNLVGHKGISGLAAMLIKKSGEGLQRCKTIVADSESTRKDIVRLLEIKELNTKVVLVPLDPYFERHRQSIYKEESYILHVGNNAWYKNRAGVIRIFARLRQHVAARLVLAGPPPDAKLEELILKSGISDSVTVIEHPDDKQLIELYQGASLFLFPSLYEGFGWPPLEAMALGCPVVCSSAASLPEVVGDAALMASAVNEQQLAEHCLSVFNDKTLALTLSEKGHKQAGQFTLERMGRELVEIYDQVMEIHAGPG